MKRASRDEDQDSSSAPTAKRSSRDDDSRKVTNASGGVDQMATKAKRPRRSDEDDVPLTFPQRLMEVLENEMLSNILSWLPHGRAFAIWDKRKFARDVMGKYFKQSKFTSFTRKLNRWGFERVARGPETGAYYHPLFQRNNLRLCLQMTCQGTKAHYQQKDYSDDQDNEEIANVVTSDGMTARKTAVQTLEQEAQKQATDMVSQVGPYQVNEDDIQDSEPTRPETNLLQIGRLEGVIEQTLLKHHLANRAAADAAALGVSRQGLLDALVGGIRSGTSTTGLASNQGTSLLQQIQLEEARRKLSSMPLVNLGVTEASSLQTAQGRAQMPGLGDLSGLSTQHFAGGNTTNHLQLRQLDEIWRMLRQPAIPTPGSVESALLGTSSLLGPAGLVGYSSNSRGTAGLSESNSSGIASQGTGSLNASQMEEARRRILLQQQIQIAHQSMMAASRPHSASFSAVAAQRFPSSGADSASALLGNMLPSTTSSDFLSMIIAQEAAQRQIREAFGTNQQSLRQSENRNFSSQQDQLNEQVLQLLQQANNRQMTGHPQDQRRPGGDDEEEDD